MTARKNASTCQWAVQTLSLEPPMWLDSWNFPWTCVRDTDARPLTTTDECASCPRWEPLHQVPSHCVTPRR